MRKQYFREYKKLLCFNLLTRGKLDRHPVDIDASACNMAEYLIKEMALRQGVTETLKASDMIKWV